MKDLILAALIAVAPAALHFRMLLGRFILEPVRSFGRPLNTLFNRFPVGPSIAAGLLGASAYLWRGEAALAIALAVVALAALTFDFVAYLNRSSYIWASDAEANGSFGSKADAPGLGGMRASASIT